MTTAYPAAAARARPAPSHPRTLGASADRVRAGVSYVMVLEYVHGYDMRRWERFVMKERKQFPGDIIAYVLMHHTRFGLRVYATGSPITTNNINIKSYDDALKVVRSPGWNWPKVQYRPKQVWRK